MTKPVYYFVEVMEKNGDFEYPSTILLRTTEKKAKKDIDKQIMDWRGCDKENWSEIDQGYWSDYTLIYEEGSQIVEEKDAKELVRIQEKYRGVNLGFHCNII